MVDNDADEALLRENANIVIHCAASIAFDAPLKEALGQNVYGALNVFDLASTFDRLDVYW